MFFSRLEIGAGMNFAVMEKFIPVALRLPWAFQMPNGFIKRGTPTSFPFTFPPEPPTLSPSSALASLPLSPELPCPELHQSLHCRHYQSRAPAVSPLKCRTPVPCAPCPKPCHPPLCDPSPEPVLPLSQEPPTVVAAVP